MHVENTKVMRNSRQTIPVKFMVDKTTGKCGIS
jgi:hypothetical protein